MKFVKRHAMVCLMLLLVTGIALAADPTGKWSWTYKAGKKDAQKDVTATADLKMENGKLTGTVTPGGKGTPVEIKDGKVNGDTVSFKVTVDRNGKEASTEYSGKLDGDTITGKMTAGAAGKTREIDWKATRTK